MWSRHGSRRSCGVEAHDRTGLPCLPVHHPPLLRLPSGWPCLPHWRPTSAAACSTTSPRSATRATAGADGTCWSRCWPWRSPRCWPAPKSLTAIGEWASDTPGQVLAAFGVRRDPLTGALRPPTEATVRRVLARIDPDALDCAIGAWLVDQHPPPGTSLPGRSPHRAVAVDGKTLRGSGHHDTQQVHLLAAMDQKTCAVLGQTEVDAKTNEITRFRPLLEGMDLSDTVVTADALHTQR